MFLVFSDDWGRHPSSCQHLFRPMLCRHEVTWVNTIGMRPPRFDLLTLRRGLGKLSRAKSTKSVELVHSSQPNVLNPMMWPWFKRGWDRRLNEKLLLKQLQAVVAWCDESVYAVTTIPIVADLMGKLQVERWIYYCVDDFGQWPGLDQQTMTDMERDLILKADTIVAAGENLATRIAQHGRTATVLTHGVDLNFWRTPTTVDLAVKLKDLERPLITFWGLIDERMDVAWIQQLSRDLKQGTILLAGPQNNPDVNLLRTPRVIATGALDYHQLPEIGTLSDVLIMPYRDVPVTQAMQPLKLCEYLATGKPVVARELPATRDWEDCLDLARSAEEFSQLVRRRLAAGVDQDQSAARARLEFHSWERRSREFEVLLLGTNVQGPQFAN